MVNLANILLPLH